MPLQRGSIVVVYSLKREKRAGGKESDEKRKAMIDEREETIQFRHVADGRSDALLKA